MYCTIYERLASMGAACGSWAVVCPHLN